MNGRDCRNEGRARRAARALSTLLVVALVGTGCATKKDLKLLRDEVIVLQQRQDSTLLAMDRQYRLLLDTLRTNFMAQLDMRGETSHRFAQLDQNLSEMQQMVVDLQTMMTQLMNQLQAQPPAPQQSPVPVPFESSGRTQPSSGEAANMLAVGRQYLEDGSTTAARYAFEELLRDYPNDPAAPEAQYYLGLVYEVNGDPDRALDELMKVPVQWPNARALGAKAYYKAGQISQDLGDLEAARRYYNEVRSQFPGTPEYEAARDRLLEIGGG